MHATEFEDLNCYLIREGITFDPDNEINLNEAANQNNYNFCPDRTNGRLCLIRSEYKQTGTATTLANY